MQARHLLQRRRLYLALEHERVLLPARHQLLQRRARRAVAQHQWVAHHAPEPVVDGDVAAHLQRLQHRLHVRAVRRLRAQHGVRPSGVEACETLAEEKDERHPPHVVHGVQLRRQSRRVARRLRQRQEAAQLLAPLQHERAVRAALDHLARQTAQRQRHGQRLQHRAVQHLRRVHDAALHQDRQLQHRLLRQLRRRQLLRPARCQRRRRLHLDRRQQRQQVAEARHARQARVERRHGRLCLGVAALQQTLREHGLVEAYHDGILRAGEERQAREQFGHRAEHGRLEVIAEERDVLRSAGRELPEGILRGAVLSEEGTARGDVQELVDDLEDQCGEALRAGAAQRGCQHHTQRLEAVARTHRQQRHAHHRHHEGHRRRRQPRQAEFQRVCE